ncbi:hypothetical protein PAXRUDRAFT_745166 [Paxillus rubicundulus Ve08.2h10]|uniref:Uncharacterized protein n=1 Tax=Paxillus rubicundulus Ve08.2h10 TaxID=930991 RepID=A0A0D0DJD1_9AGAM|nr:hypothetical protein PAXRUDRAFT_745166 [Paxillus rubicundulus Ve08.2h10]
MALFSLLLYTLQPGCSSSVLAKSMCQSSRPNNRTKLIEWFNRMLQRCEFYVSCLCP